MAVLRGVPPGRAGRLWLRRRLATATRSRGQLDRKLHLLTAERRRLACLEEEHRAEWERTCTLGATWLDRVALLSGRDGIRTARGSGSLLAQVRWTTTAGVSYPVMVTVSEPSATVPAYHATTALAPAIAAHRAAVRAGAALGAAQAGLLRLDHEIALTRRRLRALDTRWVPQLEESLRLLEAALEQLEREDWARLRTNADTAFGP
ncbi:V-type ATP synthase subunit D [Pedococcus sp. KACC 23699]|uniref:V-type ATP synthase subunit D n=1 Tax=Pedococcus sp. KACC 23699 TaxID=3149228 RepID=A0AAU7JSZ5_9MICO